MANYFSFFRAGFFPPPPISIREVGFGIKITQKLASFLRGTGQIFTRKDAEWNRGLCSGSALPWDGAALLHQEVRDLLAAETGPLPPDVEEQEVRDLLAAETARRLFGGRNMALAPSC